MEFDARLKKAKEDAAKGGDYKNLPLDTYNMKLSQAFVNKSKGGRNQTNFDWEVVEGELSGETHRAFHNLDHEVGLQIFVQDMEKMGVDASVADSLEEVNAMVEDVAAKVPVCTITIYEKKGFRNTKLAEFLGFNNEAGTATPDGEPAPSDPSGPVIEVGSKLSYKVGDKAIIGVVQAINYENETLDFPFHKGVKLSDVSSAA